jgi:hypothetical protein
MGMIDKIFMGLMVLLKSAFRESSITHFQQIISTRCWEHILVARHAPFSYERQPAILSRDGLNRHYSKFIKLMDPAGDRCSKSSNAGADHLLIRISHMYNLTSQYLIICSLSKSLVL